MFFEINGKTYKSVPFDVELLCDLEDFGISMDNLGDKAMSAVRGYFAICAHLDKKSAAREIQEHIIKNKGNMNALDPIINAMNKEMDESDFFRALSQTEEAENPES